MVQAGAKRSILIIDDEEGIRAMLESRLFKSGFNVDTAGTGLHATQKLRSGNKYDLIICDLKMPGMSGAEVYRELVRLRGKGIPFILMTGYPEKEKLMGAMKSGIEHVLLKPIRFVTLMDKIDSLLSGVISGSGQAERRAA
jgi:CheY-like chemotaxis protein